MLEIATHLVQQPTISRNVNVRGSEEQELARSMFSIVFHSFPCHVTRPRGSLCALRSDVEYFLDIPGFHGELTNLHLADIHLDVPAS